MNSIGNVDVERRFVFIERSSEVQLVRLFQRRISFFIQLNAKLFAHNLATSQSFLIMKTTQMQSPHRSHRVRPGVRKIFIHCQSWFFDLFFICFKLNLQVLEREYIIKYAKMLFLDQFFLPVARQRNEIILDGRRTCNWVLHVHSIMMSGEMATCFLAKCKFSYFDRDFQFWAHYKCIFWFDLVFLLEWGPYGCDDSYFWKIFWISIRNFYQTSRSLEHNFYWRLFFKLLVTSPTTTPIGQFALIIDDTVLRYLVLQLPASHFLIISP